MYNIIVNLLSGRENGKKSLEVVQKYLTEHNLEFRTDIITGHGLGKNLAATACAKGAEKIIAIGGDGTFSEVLNGMDFSRARLGFVPAGRGNDYSVSAGLSNNPAEAIAAIVNGRPVDHDYIQVGQRRCLNVCGTGLDVEVLRLTEEKNGTYTAALANLLIHYKPYILSVECGTWSKEFKCVMAAFCNGTQFGGGIKLCPPAKIDDGKMDLMIVEQPKIPTILVMPGFVSGRHMKKNWITHIVCERAKIIADDSASIEIDGEIFGDHIMDASIVAGGLKTFAAKK